MTASVKVVIEYCLPLDNVLQPTAISFLRWILDRFKSNRILYMFMSICGIPTGESVPPYFLYEFVKL